MATVGKARSEFEGGGGPSALSFPPALSLSVRTTAAESDEQHPEPHNTGGLSRLNIPGVVVTARSEACS